MSIKKALLTVCTGVLLSCGPVTSYPLGNNNNNNTAGPCSDGDTRCNGLSIETCQGGAWVLSITCLSPNPFCTETSLGPACTPCQSGMNVCQNGNVYSCTPEGQIGDLLEECTGDTECIAGTCTSPCLVAAAQKSYIGCDYWPTPTANLVDAAFNDNFGVVVHNANDKVAHVVITLGTTTVAERDVQPGTLETFTLNLDTGLKCLDGFGELVTDSLKVANAAYHLTSTMPVTVYQFNPLDYEIGADNSYSNDASLLLPTATLSTNYIIMARQTFGVDQYGFGFSFIPGYAAIVGTEDNTTVTVTLTSHTSAGTGITAGSPGTVQQFSLNRGEVLQLLSALPGSCTGTETSNVDGSYCDQGAAYDLTGTLVETDKPVAVYSGHLCSFVPYDTWACDHLEEMMLPLETWGKDFVVGRTEPQEADPGDPDEPNVIRIVSGADNNVIRFDPPQDVGAQTTLNKGQWVEFLATADFHVNADSAIMVGQFLVGQNYYTTDFEYHGDPAYSLMVPTEQFRDSYTFLAPSTITYNFVNVTKRVNEGGPTVMLDGQPIPDTSFSQPIGATGYGVARVLIDGTHHTITSTEPFGIVVYGFATYTSYSYPGGLDLNYINPVD